MVICHRLCFYFVHIAGRILHKYSWVWIICAGVCVLRDNISENSIFTILYIEIACQCHAYILEQSVVLLGRNDFILFQIYLIC
ncbi:hypothetical protein HZS_1754 [Henneguya salminicola]|nr:hypothetical protein HZS_1754 [Henneguya salminicola]